MSITVNDVSIESFKGRRYWAIEHDSISDDLFDAEGNFVGLLLNRQGRLSLHKDVAEVGPHGCQTIPPAVLQALGPLDSPA